MAARSDGRSASSAASRADTRLLVVTEGILTARLQQDPLLSDFTHDRPRRVPRAQRPRRPRPGAGEAGAGSRATTCASSSCRRRSTPRAVSRVLGRLPGRRRARHAAPARRCDTRPGESRRPTPCGELLPRTARPGALLPARAPRDRTRAPGAGARPAPAAVEIVPLHGSLDGDGAGRGDSRRRRRRAGSSWRRTSPRRR